MQPDPYHDFYIAVIYGDLNKLSSCQARWLELSFTDAILTAADFNRLEVIQLFLDQSNEEQRSALMRSNSIAKIFQIAIENHHIEMIMWLINKYYPDIATRAYLDLEKAMPLLREQELSQDSPQQRLIDEILFNAAQQSNIQVIKWLLDYFIQDFDFDNQTIKLLKQILQPQDDQPIQPLSIAEWQFLINRHGNDYITALLPVLIFMHLEHNLDMPQLVALRAFHQELAFTDCNNYANHNLPLLQAVLNQYGQTAQQRTDLNIKQYFADHCARLDNQINLELTSFFLQQYQQHHWPITELAVSGFMPSVRTDNHTNEPPYSNRLQEAQKLYHALLTDYYQGDSNRMMREAIANNWSPFAVLFLLQYHKDEIEIAQYHNIAEYYCDFLATHKKSGWHAHESEWLPPLLEICRKTNNLQYFEVFLASAAAHKLSLTYFDRPITALKNTLTHRHQHHSFIKQIKSAEAQAQAAQAVAVPGIPQPAAVPDDATKLALDTFKQ